ncbi:hypothetical protein VKT23_006264 [Stygiomarasmius scandens]|uniref:F-box domain-containing protein n=1 Tax=Marasmiellus scandens TaxID=2682957 RepID=A0ABR1JPC5_9AGAR
MLLETGRMTESTLMTPEPPPSATSSTPGRNSILLCNRCHHEFIGYNVDMLPSAFSRLRSNYIPSVTERSQIQLSGDEFQRDIEKYGREISRLRSILNQLEEEQRMLQQCAERLVGLLIPIRKLPTEILGEIFAFLCAPKSRFDVGNGNAPLHVALQLSQTCYFWRTVALARTELWSSIEVDLGEMDDLGYRFLSLYLQNSRHASLSLSISGADISRYPTQKQTLALKTFELLLDHADRWRSVELSCDCALFEHMSRHLSRVAVEGTYFPRLEFIDLTWVEDPDFDMASLKQSLRCFKRLPRLRSLSISDYAADCLPLSLSQLTSISFFSLGWPDHFAILDKCPNIQTLQLDGYGHYDLDPIPPHTISLAHLTSLSIDYDRNGSFVNLFQNLYVPSLKNLKICDGLQPKMASWIREAYISLQRRSGFSLRRLIIHNCILPEDDLIEILRRTPSLERLTYYEWQTSSEEIVNSPHPASNFPPGPSVLHQQNVPPIATTTSLLLTLALRPMPRLLPSLRILGKLTFFSLVSCILKQYRY